VFSLLYTHEEQTEQPGVLSTHPPLHRRIDRLLERSGYAQGHVEGVRPR
jgi:Zn-dependent protease with chaperone function